MQVPARSIAIGLCMLGMTPLLGAASEANPAAKPLAAQLVNAPDDAARDALLAAAPREVAESHDLRRALYLAASAQYAQGRFDPAIATAAYLRRLAERQSDAASLNDSEFLLAEVDVTRENDDAALSRLLPCQKFFETVGDKPGAATAMMAQSVVQLHRGDYRRALDLLRKAHDLYAEVGKKDGILATLNTMANVFGDQGQAERAADLQKQALEIAGDDPRWQLALFHNIASVYALQHDFAQAGTYMEKSAALAEKSGDQPSLGADLESLAEYYVQTGRIDDAEQGFHRALDIAKAAGNREQEAISHVGLAEVALARGGNGLAAGLEHAERGLALARETGAPTALWHSGTVAGKLRRALGRPGEAQEAFQQAIAVIEDARDRLTGGDEDAAAFLSDKLAPYEECVALLAEQNRPAEALAMTERAKARVLIEVLASPKLDLTKSMTPAEREATRRIADNVASVNKQIAAARAASPPPGPDRMAELEAALTAAHRARDAAESDFFFAHPELRSRRAPSADDALHLDRLLADGHTALIEYAVTDEATFVFTVTTKAAPVVEVHRLPFGRAALAARTREFREALAARSLGWEAGASALGHDLLSAAWPAAAGAERVVIVPDGPLWELPFQALAVSERGAPLRTLLQERSVSFAPSLTWLAHLSTRPAPDRPARLLAVGNPALAALATKTPAPAAVGAVLMDDETTPLPDAERQVDALGKLYGPERSQALVGAEAREDAFKKLAGDYDILHFATHGSLNDAAPMYSRLLMCQQDLAPDEDGFLEAWEWLPLKLHARLAVLSACETGRGRVGAGEGLIGLSWALFSAGCPASVVSQWKVDSASTTDLMLAFHRRLLAGEASAEALRGAALELATNPKYRHPFYWAPFVLIGTDERVSVPAPK